MAYKNCKKCNNDNIKKDGFKRGKQRYRCKNCGYVFQNKDRNYGNGKIWLEYSFGKQTYVQLANKYGITKQQIQKKIDSSHIKKTCKTSRNCCYNGHNLFW